MNNPRVMEALGRLQVLCVDKTGTLTRGKLKLEALSSGEALVREGEELETGHREVLEAGLRAKPEPGSEGLWHGTDRGIVKGGAKFGVDQGDWKLERELPFKPELSFHASLGRSEG